MNWLGKSELCRKCGFEKCPLRTCPHCGSRPLAKTVRDYIQEKPQCDVNPQADAAKHAASTATKNDGIHSTTPS